MELKATALGKHLAQHPYNRIRLLNAGVELRGDKHEYLLPFNQLINITCKRGVVWGVLEFELPDGKVVRLHGTEWQATKQFYHRLQHVWQQWSLEMSRVSANALQQQLDHIDSVERQDKWLKSQDVTELQQQIRQLFANLPMPLARLTQFEDCQSRYQRCLSWLQDNPDGVVLRNQQWMARVKQQHPDFFRQIEASPLSDQQIQVILNAEETLLLLAAAGCGKSAMLIARVCWLLLRNEAEPRQILLLAPNNSLSEQLEQRLHQQCGVLPIQVHTLNSLAQHIVQQNSSKSFFISQLEQDTALRRAWLTKLWQQQCNEKKAQANGWRQWLSEAFGWQLSEEHFWHQPPLVQRLAEHLDRWLTALRAQTVSQAQILQQAEAAMQPLLKKRLQLMAPLLKAWKAALKQESAVDTFALHQQAIKLLQNGRFISPWKQILVDDWQQIPPQQQQLLTTLHQQHKRTSLFATGDELSINEVMQRQHKSVMAAFSDHFANAKSCHLASSYRFNARIGEVVTHLIGDVDRGVQPAPIGLSKGNKKSVMMLPQNQLPALLDKISGYAKPSEQVLLLARYEYLKPDLLATAAIRWPTLTISFMTFEASQGQQAEYVIVSGLAQDDDAFPFETSDILLEYLLCLVSNDQLKNNQTQQCQQLADTATKRERLQLYLALTRAKHRVWLMYDEQRPSTVFDQLKQIGLPLSKKP
ncbi:DNA helicase IV [Serratia microhaemolytica]|uniref:DNA helicase IV n=1 Tax=Serratia microhaemolytica TaxID=2675110 RepID=UPI000FDEC369|nr:DNA helicase IV [Serratia microhaemolytica]